MGDVRTTILEAVGVFAGTNLDDLLVLTLLFLSARASGRPRTWEIWTGQYVGIAALVAISAASALGLTIIPGKWVRLLGLVPLAIGVRGLVKAIRGRSEGEPTRLATGLASVTGVTVSNGADNVSVYTAMFRTHGLGAGVVTVAVFVVLVAAWCLAGSWLGSHRNVVALIERHGIWIVPGVFVVLGAVILSGGG